MRRVGIDIEIQGIQKMIREFSKNGQISKGFDQRMTFAINESAFEARKRTKNYLQTFLNEPTPFTLRPPYVTKAKIDTQKAVIQSLDAQDEYLRNLESGGVSTENRVPFPGTADKYGNLRRRFTQSGIKDVLKETIDVQRKPKKLETRKQKSKDARKRRDKNSGTVVNVPTVAEIKKELGSRKINSYYIGGSSDGSGRMGLWRRLAGNKGRRMIYLFKRRQTYKSGTINLKNFWTREAGKVMDEQFSKSWLSQGDSGRSR